MKHAGVKLSSQEKAGQIFVIRIRLYNLQGSGSLIRISPPNDLCLRRIVT